MPYTGIKTLQIHCVNICLESGATVSPLKHSMRVSGHGECFVDNLTLAVYFSTNSKAVRVIRLSAGLLICRGKGISSIDWALLLMLTLHWLNFLSHIWPTVSNTSTNNQSELETPNTVSSDSGVWGLCEGLRPVPWLLLGSACTWFPHLESDPSVHESPNEERSSSEQRSAAQQHQKGDEDAATRVFAEWNWCDGKELQRKNIFPPNLFVAFIPLHIKLQQYNSKIEMF